MNGTSCAETVASNKSFNYKMLYVFHKSYPRVRTKISRRARNLARGAQDILVACCEGQKGGIPSHNHTSLFCASDWGVQMNDLVNSL